MQTSAYAHTLVDPEEAAARLEHYRERCAARGVDFLATAVQQEYSRVIGEPAAYPAFGPLWWAVKRILRAHGRDLGTCDDGPMAEAAALRGADGAIDEALTMAAADVFRDHYYADYLEGSRDFDAPDGDSYRLVDPDMERRIRAAVGFVE
ncbi:hypothetical protein IP84_00790 [beta proteobacterium AAP99]|nr:hypothetical protein IP84_00790 [beta proteobacterium AAP99]